MIEEFEVRDWFTTSEVVSKSEMKDPITDKYVIVNFVGKLKWEEEC